jgi:hypothetical protein
MFRVCAKASRRIAIVGSYYGQIIGIRRMRLADGSVEFREELRDGTIGLPDY